MMPPRNIQWSPKGVKLLIKHYEGHPNLYDAKHKQYHNRQIRSDSMNMILLQMRILYDDINTSDLKTKIGTLRSQYLAHIKKEANGKSTDYKMAPYWLNNLEFLKPFFKLKGKKLSSSKFQITTDAIFSNDNRFEQQSETISEVSVSNSSLPSVSEELIEGYSMNKLLDTTRETLLKVANNKRKYHPVVENFGEYIKAEMDRIEKPHKRRAIRLKIMKVFVTEEV